MLFFVTGASGSGKTACIDDLRAAMPGAKVYDFDSIGVPEHADALWRQKATEHWLRQYVQSDSDIACFCVCGQVVLGEILACPSAKQVRNIYLFHLDVSDSERIRRLYTQHPNLARQEMLNWAAWLRMHHCHPEWKPEVIKNSAWEKLDFARWEGLKDWKGLATIKVLDTTSLPPKIVASSIAYWMQTLHSKRTKFMFRSAELDDLPALVQLLEDDPLGEMREDAACFNKYEPAFHAILNDVNHLILVVTQQKAILGCVEISFLPNLTYKGSWRAQLEGVRIKSTHRGRGLGSLLIQEAIKLAKARCCKIVQLTTNKVRVDALRLYKSLGFEETHSGLKLFLII